MLKQMRDQAQNFKWILWAVILSFLISFVVIFQGGVGGLSPSTVREPARVGSRVITADELRQAVGRQEEMLRQFNGGQLDVSRLVNPSSVLDMLIDHAVLLEEAKRAGIEPSPKEVARRIRGFEAFKGADGKFDRALYREFLDRRGLRASEFEKQVADDIAYAAVYDLLGAGATVSNAELKEAWKRQNETASADYVLFPLDPHLAAVTVSDAEARAWYDAHQKDYDAGAARQVRYVRFSRDDLGKALEKEDEMRAYYQENAASVYTMTEDQRRASILVAAAPPGASDDEKAAARAKAEDAARRARAGEDFAALARELSDDEATRERGGDLGAFYRGFHEDAVDEAIFSANEGDVVGPIETTRGFEVFLVTKGAGSKTRSFEEVRELVSRALYSTAAADAQVQAVQKFEAALTSPDDFEKAAMAAGVTVSEPAWITRSADIPGLEPNPSLNARAFELEPKTVSEPLGDPDGQVVLQVLDSRESSPQTFEEARAAVDDAVRRDEARSSARAEAEAFRAEAAAAPDFAAAAGSRPVATATAIRRGQPVPVLGQAPDFVAVAFETPVGQIGRVADVPQGAAVLKVTARTEFDDAKFEADRDALQRQLEGQQAMALREAATKRLKEAYGRKIKRDEEYLAMLTPAPAPARRGG